MTGLLRLYPGWWRDRYGEEVTAIREVAARDRADRVDLLRGALDAWLHPPVPSRIPGIAALVGGGLWTAVAAGIAAQPVAPDWPGYSVDVLGLAVAAVAWLVLALVGIAIRGLDRAGRRMGSLIGLAMLSYTSWMVALIGTMSTSVDGVSLAAAQTVAMTATAAIGVALIRLGDDRVGSLVLLGGVTMLIPWPGTWLTFGAIWTVIGLTLLVERSIRRGAGRLV